MSNLLAEIQESVVQKIDGYYLYQVGAAIHPLSEINKDTTYLAAHLPLLIAKGTLETFLVRSVFKPRLCWQNGKNLLELLSELITNAENKEMTNQPIGAYKAYQLTTALTSFETVLGAEFGAASDIYLVSKKRGYDTTDLIERGTVLFPDDLILKVPSAQLDVEQGARCLAFELPTAAGFHFHRANESVLHAYYDAVTRGKPRPEGRNIGDYIAELKKNNAGDAAVLSCLKDLKDLHRNPLIHPEHTLEDTDEAIALLGLIHSAIVRMLKAIPSQPTASEIITAPPGP